MTEHRAPEQADDTPLCGEPADPGGWFRCGRPAGHGERHQATLPGGTYTWGYVAAADTDES